MYVLIIVLKLLNPAAVDFAESIIKHSLAHHIDPLLTVAVMHTESRLENRRCFRGAHGLMQIQLSKRSCSKTLAQAQARGLYIPDDNIKRGVELLAYWRHWGRRRLGYHWLLHYNQGFGVCPSGSHSGCAQRDKTPILTGYPGGYAQRVLITYRKIRGVLTCLTMRRTSLSVCARRLSPKLRWKRPANRLLVACPVDPVGLSRFEMLLECKKHPISIESCRFLPPSLSL